MPLGDIWSGVCQAQAGAPFQPDEQALSEQCNMGYARGKCPRFPDRPAADAVRFLIVRDQDEIIQVDYAAERDHLPHAVGVLKYSQADGAFVGAEHSLLERQARAYVSSYLRRRPVAV